MSTLTLKHYEHITKDLVPLVVEAQRSLVSGMPPYEELPEGEKQFSQKAVVAYHEDVPVGIFLFSVYSKTLEGVLAYVKPEYRRMGCYTLMLNGLVEEAKRRDLANIVVYVDIDNQVSNKTQLAVGFKHIMNVYSYTI